MTGQIQWDPEDFWGSFAHSAWRLELLPEYEETGPRVAQFLAGGAPEPYAEWISGLESARSEGRTVGRVHVIGELTDYLRYELALYEMHAAAGEDIRILSADVAGRIDLPDFDYWLLDRQYVMVMQYGEHGVLTGLRAEDDPATVDDCVHAADLAHSLAMPVADWLERRAA
jgi:hypothetical protein